jgi:hypothetical protein
MLQRSRLPFLFLAALAVAPLTRAQVPSWPKTTPADITAAGLGVQLTGADYGNGTFVLAAYFGGTTAVPAITPAVFTSPDGTAWTRRSLPGGTGRTGTPRFVKGRFLLGVTPASSTGSGGNGVIFSSTDGVTWTASAPLGSSINAPTEFAYNNGVFAGPLSSGGMQVATSNDGLTWTPRAIVAGGSAGHITAFNGKFYVNCYGSGTVSGLYSSADGIAWTKVAGAPANPGILAANSSTLMVTFFSGSTSGQSLSTDGVTFTTASPGISLQTETIKVLNDAFVVTASASPASFDLNLARASSDGRTWTTIGTVDTQFYSPEVAYGNGRYVFVGEFDVFAGTSSISPGGGGTGGNTGGGVASYAGTYTGKIGSRVNGVVNDALNDYSVVITPTGNVTANIGGVASSLVGSINAAGAITFTSGFGIALYNLTTASVAGGVLSSDYNAVLGNSGAQYRFLPSGGGATAAPLISVPPASQTVAAGGSVTFTVTVGGTGNTFQWLFNGNAIAGAVDAAYTIANLTAAHAGNYAVRVTNSAGTTTSGAATLTVTGGSGGSAGAYLANLSIRSTAGAGAQTLIVGVTIGGANTSGTKNLLVRGIGPGLAAFGLPGTLADPRLDVVAGNTVIASNDNWDAAATPVATQSSVGAFALTAGSKDAALLGNAVTAGGYSVQITGAGGGTGLALAELYDLTPAASFGASTPRLINLSARTQVGRDGDILIAGFNVAGAGQRRLLVRAVGPGLATFGLGGTLADPKLEIYSGNTVVAANDNWDAAATPAATQASVGAFALPAGSKDAVLIVTLAPGSYTAQVSGAGNTTGLGLVELYELP